MKIRAVLCDIDGTLMWKGKAIPGAAQAVQTLRDRGLAMRFLTNITTRMPGDIAGDLREVGIQAEDCEVLNAVTSCVTYLDRRPRMKCHLLLPKKVLPAFANYCTGSGDVGAVIIGDIGTEFNYQTLNHAFGIIRSGAELIALQRNMFWFDENGARLDCGAFVAALEAATGVSATITGKPSELFFNQALHSLGMSSDEVLVVGDDPLTDIDGANRINAVSLLVRTGKSESAKDESKMSIASIEELPAWFERNNLCC